MSMGVGRLLSAREKVVKLLWKVKKLQDKEEKLFEKINKILEEEFGQ